VRWKLPAEQRDFVLTSTASGQSSRKIADVLHTSASYIRHVRSKLRSRPDAERKVSGLVRKADRVRFSHERGEGIPQSIALDQRFARLLGLYCAEGCVVRDSKRPNSYKINFSFSHRERAIADDVRTLLKQCFRIESQLVWRSTTLAVTACKASAALLLQELCGTGASGKQVPAQLLDAPLDVARAFLDAYVSGDGHRYRSGKVSVTTVSHQLAHGVATLALKLGFLPSLYRKQFDGSGLIQGRTVQRQPSQYCVVWYENQPADLKRRVIETRSHFLIPLRSIRTESFEGSVFNMQVADEHTYVANLLAVSNCQNWVTSQMLRDVDAVSAPKMTSPKQLVDLAIAHGAPVVASSYNEPLITSEWAVDVFKEARARDLLCAYISNGNATPQVLDFIRPYVSAYKVDLKTFNPKHYRELGGVMENVTDTIRMLKERGFWVEIVTLVVPGFSDDQDELKRMADFIASVDPLMPWHMTAFHPDYKMTDGYRSTTVDDLMRIVDHAQRAGLKYIYPGNLPGQVGHWENTRCHHCGETVIERFGFRVKSCRVAADGKCPKCANVLPGIWGRASGHGDGKVRALL
jgi:pyruvate formate lyase activating enzyme